MRSHSPGPLQDLLDDLVDGDDRTAPAADPRVQAVLLAVHDRLTEPPDELTRRRHLGEIRRTSRRVRAARRAGNLGRVSAVAAVVVLVLATTGLLPATLQQTVADAATLVGITLPTPGPTPASEEVHDEVQPISEIGDIGVPTPGLDDEAEPDTAEEPRSEPGPGQSTGADALETLHPAQLPSTASERAHEAVAEAGQGAERAPDHARAGDRPGQASDVEPGPPSHAEARGRDDEAPRGAAPHRGDDASDGGSASRPHASSDGSDEATGRSDQARGNATGSSRGGSDGRAGGSSDGASRGTPDGPPGRGNRS